MKKFIMYFCVVVITMCFAACSSSSETTDALELKVELIENEVDENISDAEEDNEELEDLDTEEERIDLAEENALDVVEDSIENIVSENDEDYTEQLQVIINQKEVWEDSVQFEIYCYAVTDFNHNGLLEIVASSCQGTGMYTYSNIWEVNDSFDGLVQYEVGIIEGSSEPDFIINQITTYVDDESGRYYYMVDDYIRVGMAENYTSKQATFFEDNIMFVLYLGTKSEFYDIETEEISIIYEDADRIEITEDVYNELEENHFGLYEKKMTYVNWIASSEEMWQNDKEGALLNSWNGFSIE